MAETGRILFKSVHETKDESSNIQFRRQLFFLKYFKKWSWTLLIIACLIQCAVFWSVENTFGVLCCIFAWKLATTLIINPYNLNRYTLSTFVIIGFCLTQYILPVIFILLEGKPLVYNLNFPVQVFIHSILALLVLIVTHMFYKSLKMNSLKSGIQMLMKRNHLFQPPTNTQIWLMGLIGLTAMFVSYFFIKQSFENQSEGTGNKFIEGLIPFTYAPYFLIIKNLYANDNSKIKRFFPKILAFTIIVFAVGIGGNARSLFITGIVAAGIGYFLGLLLGKFEFKILTGKNIMIASIAFWLLTGPIADIGTAMLVVRQQRGTISKEAMLRKTIDVYEDKEALRVYKKIADENRLIREWDEHYFDNIFLARFCNLKFNDASLEQYNKIGRVDPQLQQFSIDRSLAVLPQPMLSLLQIDIDKIKLISSSFGDNLFSRAGGSYALGGFRLGQFAGTGMASFGWWYLLILAVGIIPVYFALDLFVIHSKGIRRTLSSPLLSLSGLIPITTIFMFLSLSSISESVVNLYTYLLRGWPQLVILYWLMFFITRRIGWLISSK